MKEEEKIELDENLQYKSWLELVKIDGAYLKYVPKKFIDYNMKEAVKRQNLDYKNK